MGLGKKQMEQLSGFSQTIAAYTVGTIISTIYLTEWKAVCQYIPFFNMQEKFQGPKKNEE